MSLHDPNFKYRPSFDTDVGRHLRKFKRDQATAQRKEPAPTDALPRSPAAKVSAIAGRNR